MISGDALLNHLFKASSMNNLGGASE